MSKHETDDLIVHYNVKTCIHARRCVLGLPQVFRPDAKPWIQPDEAGTEALIEVIEACPSGALTYERKDGGVEETAPEVNTLRLWENGPLELRGDIRMEGHPPRKRVLLCRCGKTENPPFCNNAHREGFHATGLPDFDEQKDVELESRDGPVEVVPSENGPYMIKGNVEIIGTDGHRIARTRKTFLCRCGASGDRPFCDGSHNKIGFTKAPGAEE